MRTWNLNTQACSNPQIIAARLTSMRNIYLREELRNIAKQIQDQFKERLPVLPLVSLAAYEQVFRRQPSSLPDKLRQDAVKYGLEYYQLHIDKLRTIEANNGLCPVHDRLSCTDKKCSLHQTDSTESNVSHTSSISDDTPSTRSSSSSISDTSIRSITTPETSISSRTSSRTNIPKIVISRTSDSNSQSSDSANSTIMLDDDDSQISTDTE